MASIDQLVEEGKVVLGETPIFYKNATQMPPMIPQFFDLKRKAWVCVQYFTEGVVFVSSNHMALFKGKSRIRVKNGEVLMYTIKRKPELVKLNKWG